MLGPMFPEPNPSDRLNIKSGSQLFQLSTSIHHNAGLSSHTTCHLEAATPNDRATEFEVIVKSVALQADGFFWGIALEIPDSLHQEAYRSDSVLTICAIPLPPRCCLWDSTFCSPATVWLPRPLADD